MSSSSDGVNRFLLNTAETSALSVSADLDVSFETPVGTPGVSHEVVVAEVGVSAVADSGDGVVHDVAALVGGHNTTGVVVEDNLLSVKGDGDDLLGDSGLKLGLTEGENLVVGSELSDTAGFSSASLVDSGVGVVSQGADAIVTFDVCEAPSLPATVAAIRLGVAIDALLLGELEELTVGKEPSTFNGGNGGESPAGTALGLVLNGVDGTGGSPVDGLGEVVSGDDDGVLSGGFEAVSGGGSDVSFELGLLGLSPVGEFVVSDGGGGHGVAESVSGELVTDGNPVGHSGLELLNGSVALSVLDGPGEELLFKFVGLGGDDDGGGEESGSHYYIEFTNYIAAHIH